MPDLEKNRNINIPQEFWYAGYEISAIYALLLNIRLDRNKATPVFVAHSWISKIKGCLKITFVEVYQIENQINLHIW